MIDLAQILGSASSNRNSGGIFGWNTIPVPVGIRAGVAGSKILLLAADVAGAWHCAGIDSPYDRVPVPILFG